MKNAVIALALTAAFSGSAFAATEAPAAAKTRAEVVAELQQAYANGELPVGELGTNFQAPVGQPLSRTEVVAQLRDARAHGQLPQTTLDYPPVAVDRTSTDVSRAEVVHDLQVARAHGDIEPVIF